jgi:hypothetical protein
MKELSDILIDVWNQALYEEQQAFQKHAEDLRALEKSVWAGVTETTGLATPTRRSFN